MYLRSPFVPETNFKPKKKKIVLTNICASLRSLKRERKKIISGFTFLIKKKD